MFPSVGATELMVIASIALIVVGPKDLPVLMRKAGQFMARMRGMAAEFRASFDEMARQSELDELRREVQALRSGEYMKPVKDAVSSHSAPVHDVFNDIEQDLTSMPDPWVEPTNPAPQPALLEEAPPAPATPQAKPRARTKAAAKPVARPPAKRKPKAAPEASS